MMLTSRSNDFKNIYFIEFAYLKINNSFDRLDNIIVFFKV